jgi:hypothetical protein
LDVSETIASAWKAVVDAELPESLYEVGFREALHMIQQRGGTAVLPMSGTVATFPAVMSATAQIAKTQGIEEAQEAEAPEVKSSSELLAKFAAESGISVDELEEVFYFDKGVPMLNGPVRKLGSTVTEKTRTVTLCLTAAYNFALDVVQTLPDVVRAECDRLKCLDSKNFSAYAGSTKGVSYLGPTGKKYLKVNQDTLVLLTDAVRSIREAA